MAHTIQVHEPMSPLAPRLLREMFQLRHRVFKERMGWKVGFLSDMERDCYDLMSPVYAVAEDSSGRIDGCWRLMPTTGPYLLKDVFPSLLYDHPVPASPLVWEASRFAVDTTRGHGRLRGVTETTAILVAALLEFGLSFGIEKIIAVSDLRFERVLHRTGLKTQRFGQPQAVESTWAVAGWFDVTRENLERIRTTNAIAKAVLSETLDLVQAA